MAVAVHSVGMGATERLVIHPFFDAPKTKLKPVKTATESTALTPSSSTLEPLIETSVTTNWGTAALQTWHSKEHVADSVPCSPALLHSATTSIDTVGIPESHDRRSLHHSTQEAQHIHGLGQGLSTVLDKNGFALDTSAGQVSGEMFSGTDIDLDASRRKRRRTTPNVEEHLLFYDLHDASWEEQSQEASLVKSTPKPDTSHALQNTDQEESMTSKSMVDNPMTARDLRSPATRKLLSSSTASEQLASAQSHLLDGTPKMKMLRLRTDGRLVSPKSRTDPGASKLKAKRDNKVASKSVRGKPIILRYGSDVESKTSVGQKIDAILASAIKSNNVDSSKVDVLGCSLGSMDPQVPTHPFFRAKTTSESTTKQETFKTDEQSVIVKENGPKKRIEITAAAAQAWAAIGQLTHNAGGGAELSKYMKLPGMSNPIWPPKDMHHCRGLTEERVPSFTCEHSMLTLKDQKKLKGGEMLINDDENIIRPLPGRGGNQSSRIHVTGGVSTTYAIRNPCRRLMTAPQLQEALRCRVVASLPSTSSLSLATTENDVPIPTSEAEQFSSTSRTHDALLHIFLSISTSLSAFDKYECENRDWIQKYSPKSAAQVLQQGQETVLLRDWLRSSSVSSVDSGHPVTSKIGKSTASTRKLNSKRKRRRKIEELDGFIISSDEDLDQLDELSGPEETLHSSIDNISTKKSMVRSGGNTEFSKSAGSVVKTSNAVVLSGPHGCGKTATVYAVAQELGFEVFEINAGSRRSGKDLLEKVGDMTRNHLVHQASESEITEELHGQHSKILQHDLESGLQTTMQSFLKPKMKNRQGSGIHIQATKDSSVPQEPPRKHKQQKQSLILLEEVDLLFEEDRQFWTTTLGLILHSRRPIIMTCTDESRLPLDDMILHAIFRLYPPPEQLATDYLILIAGNEGHLLARDAVMTLYRSKNDDLRASIMELNFWCQMAVGDKKGGLEWMLIRSHAEECHDEHGRALRVVSDGTYHTGMGLLGDNHHGNDAEDDIAGDIDLLSAALREWGLDVNDWIETMEWNARVSSSPQISAERSRELLEAFDISLDALSAGDIMPGLGFRQDESVGLESPLLTSGC